MKTRTRIVTFMRYPELLKGNPQEILEGGSRKVTLGEKQRYFAVRKVTYDDSMTPVYATPAFTEKRYNSLREILDEGKHQDWLLYPILDLDHSLKSWDDDTK